MSKAAVVVLLALFLCSGCALVGYTPNHDAKMKIFKSPDWSDWDTYTLHKFVNYFKPEKEVPYAWASRTNKDVEYKVTTLHSFKWSNYFAREFTLVKTNKVSGETVTTRITALKDDGMGGSRMPGPCDYDKYEFSFCLI